MVSRIFGEENQIKENKIVSSFGLIIYVSIIGYSVVEAIDVIQLYVEVTVQEGVLSVGVIDFLNILIRRSPVLAIFLLSLSMLSSFENRGFLVSSLLPAALFIGINFALFGVPPLMRNAFEPSLIGGLAIGFIGWALAFLAKSLFTHIQERKSVGS